MLEGVVSRNNIGGGFITPVTIQVANFDNIGGEFRTPVVKSG